LVPRIPTDTVTGSPFVLIFLIKFGFEKTLVQTRLKKVL
jgi:hypothetical protein